MIDPNLSPKDHDYLDAGDNPHASGDTAYTGCSLCGRRYREHRNYRPERDLSRGGRR